MIELEHVSRTFRRRGARRGLRREAIEVRAVDDLSFGVARGEVVGYVGANGAGKSTTVKMLTGILVPSSGVVRVAGLDPARQRIELARRIGVVFGQRVQLWWDLPLRDSFELLRHMYRLGREAYRQRLAQSVELLQMHEFIDTPVRQLSLGQRMRGELAAAMLHEPEVLFLDEPTVGLDVVAKARVREYLAEVNRERGVTILLTTHDLADIERLCERMVILDRGTCVYDGRIDELKQRFGGRRTVVVDTVEPVAAIEVAGARVARVDGVRQWLRLEHDDASAADVIAAVVHAAPVVDVSLEEPDIEQVVARIYGMKHPGDPAR